MQSEDLRNQVEDLTDRVQQMQSLTRTRQARMIEQRRRQTEANDKEIQRLQSEEAALRKVIRTMKNVDLSVQRDIATQSHDEANVLLSHSQ